MKNIFILFIILINLTLLAQEKEKITEPKKWGITTGLTSDAILMPILNILYGLNENFRLTLSIRKRDIKNTNMLLDGSASVYSYRWDRWFDSYSYRNAIVPGIEWFPNKDSVYITTRLGYEVYEYKSHNNSFYHEYENGYTSYRAFDINTNRKRIFGELGFGYRYYFWKRLILGWEIGGRKIFNSQYQSNSDNDLTFYRNSNPTVNYPTTYSEEKFKTFNFYFAISLGIAF